MHAQLSLARTAELLAALGKSDTKEEITSARPDDYTQTLEDSDWGPGLRLRPALSMGEARMSWSLPASKLGTSQPAWSSLKR